MSKSSFLKMDCLSYLSSPCHVALPCDESLLLTLGGCYITSEVPPLVFDSSDSNVKVYLFEFLWHDLTVCVVLSLLGNNGGLIFRAILKTLLAMPLYKKPPFSFMFVTTVYGRYEMGHFFLLFEDNQICARDFIMVYEE